MGIYMGLMHKRYDRVILSHGEWYGHALVFWMYACDDWCAKNLCWSVKTSQMHITSVTPSDVDWTAKR